MRISWETGIALLLAGLPAFAFAQTATQHPQHPSHPALEAPDCTARVGYDRDMTMPGYLLPSPHGTTCIPFSTAAATPPEGYRGDYYVDEFTDAKLRERYRDCMK